MATRLLSAVLVGVFLINGLPAFATEPVRHLYLDDSTKTVILLAKPNDLKKEAEEFRDFRYKYALLWTGIITVLAAYAYTRNK